MARILVTGSNGTIGTRLCEKLVERGYDVVGADCAGNRWNKDVGKLTIKIDLRDKKKALERLPKDVDAIVHLAANASVRDLIADPKLAIENFETLFSTLEYARANGIKKFIFASSREVYGDNKKAVCGEGNATPDNCESPYAASKVGGEGLIRAYNRCYGIDAMILRFSNVYGMYDDRDRVIPLFIRRCIAGEDLYVFGKEKVLDLIHIDDVVGGIIQGIKRFGPAKNEAYNIAQGSGTTVLEVANLVRECLKSRSKVLIRENRVGEVMQCIPDNRKAKEVLGFSPKVSVKEGIERSVEWYLQNIGHIRK